MKAFSNRYLLILLAPALILSACSSHKKQQAAPTSMAVPVAVQQVKQENAVYNTTYPATVVALNEVQLRAQVSGYLTHIYVNDAQQVVKGQRLYEIDKSKYQATYLQAKAAVQQAQANLDKAQRDLKRYEFLDQHQAIAKQQLDYSKTNVETAKSQLEAAKADLSKAGEDLQYATINAPFSGTIGITQVKLGGLVSAGQTLLNTISSNNPVGVDFNIDENDIPFFVNILRDKQNANDSLFSLVEPDKSIYPHEGHLQLIDRAVDPQTGTIKVRLSYPNQDHTLKPGMSCNIQVRHRDSAEAIVIPQKALVENMGEYFVFVADRDTARQIKVEPGAQIQNAQIIIKSGLKPGMQIVTEGTQRLNDGSAIQTGTSQQQTAAKQPATK